MKKIIILGLLFLAPSWIIAMERSKSEAEKALIQRVLDQNDPLIIYAVGKEFGTGEGKVVTCHKDLGLFILWDMKTGDFIKILELQEIHKINCDGEYVLIDCIGRDTD